MNHTSPKTVARDPMNLVHTQKKSEVGLTAEDINSHVLAIVNEPGAADFLPGGVRSVLNASMTPEGAAAWSTLALWALGRAEPCIDPWQGTYSWAIVEPS